jgi:hypothetical protein
MGSANHIGRVAALAVALGVGVAVAQPGLAAADDTGSATDGSTQSQSTPADDGSVTDTVPPAEPEESVEQDEPDEPESAEADLDELDEFEPEEPELEEPGEPEVPSEPAPDPVRVRDAARHVVEPEVESGVVVDDDEPAEYPGDAAAEAVAEDVPAVGAAVRRVDPPVDSVAPLAVAVEEPVMVPIPAAPSPVMRLLAVPAALFAATVDLVVTFFEPVVGPGSPLENALLWGVLAWTRRQVNATFANRGPDIGADEISLEVAAGAGPVSIGELPATDADGETIIYTLHPDYLPANGSVSIVGNVITYTPDEGFVGEDNFLLFALNGGLGFQIYHPMETPYDRARVTIAVADDDLD